MPLDSATYSSNQLYLPVRIYYMHPDVSSPKHPKPINHSIGIFMYTHAHLFEIVLSCQQHGKFLKSMKSR